MMTILRWRLACLLPAVAAGGLSTAGWAAKPVLYSTYTSIYDFQSGNDGQAPQGGLVMDREGRIYGTTKFGGSHLKGQVFRLTRPVSGTGPWTKQVLHSFIGPEGQNPVSPVLLGGDGTIYGTTPAGGAHHLGTVFRIANTPDASFTVLHDFQVDHDGGAPTTGLTFGPGGLLYGSTTFYDYLKVNQEGLDYSISPLGDTVEYRLLDAFDPATTGAPPSGLTAVPRVAANHYMSDLVGATTINQFQTLAASVYTLTIKPNGAANMTVLYSFDPAVLTPLIPPIVGYGALAGSLFGCGIGGVYQLVPSGPGSAAESQIATFTVQNGGVPASPFVGNSCSVIQATASGILFGTTDEGGYGYGTVFQLSPPATAGVPWTLKTDVSFNGSNGRYPITSAGTLLQSGSVFYGSLGYGGKYGQGEIYEVTPLPPME